jgi:hypothetical protein
MQQEKTPVLDPTRPQAEQIAALRQAVEECYCGLGPACHLWTVMSPDQRVECSIDKRVSAQRFWRTGM